MIILNFCSWLYIDFIRENITQLYFSWHQFFKNKRYYSCAHIFYKNEDQILLVFRLQCTCVGKIIIRTDSEGLAGGQSGGLISTSCLHQLAQGSRGLMSNLPKQCWSKTFLVKFSHLLTEHVHKDDHTWPILHTLHTDLKIIHHQNYNLLLPLEYNIYYFITKDAIRLDPVIHTNMYTGSHTLLTGQQS